MDVPLGFAGCDKLVNHDLRAISEVTKLSFPQGQRVWQRHSVSVLKTKHSILRQVRATSNEGAAFLVVFCLNELVDGAVVAVAILVEHVGVSMRESSSLNVLA